LPVAAEDWVYRYCDPCGEYRVNREHAKVPDAALPNSAMLQARQVSVIRPPPVNGQENPQQQVSLDGRMWTLTIIVVPLFRTPLILVASMVNGELTQDMRVKLMTAWNQVQEPPPYPEWQLLDRDESTFWSTINFRLYEHAIKPDLDTGVSGDIEQYRFTSYGLTVHFNTPSLVNQGMVMGAQWATSRGQKAATVVPLKINSSVVDFTIPAMGGFLVMSATTAFQVFIPAVNEDVWQLMTNGRGIVAKSFTVNQGGAPILKQNPFVMPRLFVNNANVLNVNMTFQNSIELSYRSPAAVVTLIPANSDWVLNVIRLNTTQPRLFSVTLSVTVGADTIVVVNAEELFAGQDIRMSLTRVFGAEGDDWDAEQQPSTVQTLELPPTTNEDIVQSTPKSVVLMLKDTEGCYMPMRIFQPVYNAQAAASMSPICLIGDGISDLLPTAVVDTMDLNYGSGVMILSSIPYACAPVIKLIRDTEMIASKTSLIQGVMEADDDKCEPALEIARSITTHHPFMYPKNYNCLGGLFKMITGIVNKVPILGNVVGAIAPIVQGLLPTEFGNDSGSANIDNLMAKLPQLVEMLNLKG
jgi:hypothetical protein